MSTFLAPRKALKHVPAGTLGVVDEQLLALGYVTRRREAYAHAAVIHITQRAAVQRLSGTGAGLE